MGTAWFGPTNTDALVTAAKRCINEWGDDPAYVETTQKLREVVRELDVLTESPAARQAARLAPPNQSGQA